ncbi:hypothetical protein [Mycolicibacterium sp. HK-90]|uniref:hypothetical protein n=1 Tax=Mycolicibacterium sp. HK-90 TaxID=3056937 RepID=UPI0026595FDD|nr:hypothetical protein [Mycolicibacterium sp. HK-90]WKG04271.1 hypothetical protein QU592_03900 [Mycolicibacterium sp. HK-90]
MTDTAGALTRTVAALAMIVVTTTACGDRGSEVTADAQIDTATPATTAPCAG